jgi:hypothetical protein
VPILSTMSVVLQHAAFDTCVDNHTTSSTFYSHLSHNNICPTRCHRILIIRSHFSYLPRQHIELLRNILQLLTVFHGELLAKNRH